MVDVPHTFVKTPVAIPDIPDSVWAIAAWWITIGGGRKGCLPDIKSSSVATLPRSCAIDSPKKAINANITD